MAQLTAEARPVAGTDGSRTITLLDSGPSRNNDEPAAGALRLRGGPRRTRQTVAWDDDVVDNEGCGRKKSKICCIYHKPKRFDESSDEDSSSESDDDSPCDHSHEGSTHPHRHSRSHHPRRTGDEGGAGRARDPATRGVIHEIEDRSEYRNAYERVPGQQKGKGKAP